jgi:hypothetical protein
MPSAFRRIADELDPNYVPDWALRNRRPVPVYVPKLLSIFGLRWLPRLGLGLVLAGTIGLVAGMVAFASRSWGIAVLIVLLSVGCTIGGSLFWTSYRMRHWLPGGAGANAPPAPPIGSSAWVWMCLAVGAAFGGFALMIRLTFSGRSVRDVVLGAAVLSICSGIAGAAVIKFTDRISPGSMKVMGWPAGRFSLIFLGVGVFIGATLLFQLPFLGTQLGPR